MRYNTYNHKSPLAFFLACMNACRLNAFIIRAGIRSFICIVIALFFISVNSYGQYGYGYGYQNGKNPINAISVNSLKLSCKLDTITISEGDVVSNIVSVMNRGAITEQFSIEVGIPYKWKQVIKSRKTYEVAPGQTIYLPVRIVPDELIGNTLFQIPVLCFNEAGKQLGNTTFLVTAKKITQWDLNKKVPTKIYLKNRQTRAAIAADLVNDGNADEKFAVSAHPIGNKLIVVDSNGQQQKNTPNDVVIQPGTNVPLKYNVVLAPKERNNRIDPENYSSNDPDQEDRAHINVIASKFTDNKSIDSRDTRSFRVEVVHLPNTSASTDYDYGMLPLIIDLNSFNMFTDYPMYTADIHGLTYFTNHRYLSYRLLSYFGTQYAQQYFNLSYNSLRWGFNGSNFGSSNSGFLNRSTNFNGYYYLLPNRLYVSAFYGGATGFFQPDQVKNFGATVSVKVSRNYFTQFGYSRIVNPLNKENTNRYNLQNNFSLSRHTVGLGVFYDYATNYWTKDSSYNKTGYGTNVSYSTHIGKFGINASDQIGLKNSPYIRNGNNLRGNINYNINKNSNLFLTSYYRDWNAYTDHQQSLVRYYPGYTAWMHQLTFSTSNKYGNFSVFPYVRYDDYLFTRILDRRLGVSYSQMIAETSLRYMGSVQVGYDKDLLHPGTSDYLVSTIFSSVAYRYWRLQGFYNTGPSSGADALLLEQNHFNPKRINLNFTHQIPFYQQRFLWENMARYQYQLFYQRNSYGFSSELYYFSHTGYRLKLSLDYSLNRKDIDAGNEQVGLKSTGDPLIVSSHFLQFGAGIRKEFDFALNKQMFNVDFIAYSERRERPLENVVIRLGEREVITSEDGKARIEKVSRGAYPMNVFTLDDHGALLVPEFDSLFIARDELIAVPFIRGIHVYGTVNMDREKYSRIAQKELNLSRIRISAMDHVSSKGSSVKGKVFTTLTDDQGHFDFYLPVGQTFIFSMNEEILSDQFKLLQNDIALTLDKNVDNVYVPFYIVEKRRKNNVMRFTDNDSARTAQALADSTKNDTLSKEKGSADYLKLAAQVKSIAAQMKKLGGQYKTPDEIKKLLEEAKRISEETKKVAASSRISAEKARITSKEALKIAKEAKAIAKEARRIAEDARKLINDGGKRSGSIQRPNNGFIRISEEDAKGKDALSRLAVRYGTTAAMFMELNMLKSDKLVAGQVLKVPSDDANPFGDAYDPKNRTYTVQPGNTISSVAAAFGMNVRELMALNNLTSQNIKPGQKLRVKEIGKPASGPNRVTSYSKVLRKMISDMKQSPDKVNTYTVSGKDNLNSIAIKFGIGKKALMKMNNLTSEKIYPGQILKIVE